jgi:hypothetical protein
MPTNLMGIDVGFSAIRLTTGIACLDGDHLSLERAGTAWESREAKIPLAFTPASSPLMDHCFRWALMSTFVAMLNPFPFALEYKFGQIYTERAE